MSDTKPAICVFAPLLQLTITVEPVSRVSGDPDAIGDECEGDIHLHPGGQGFWIARMLQCLGERPVLVGPVGGEPGTALAALLEDRRIELQAVPVEFATSAYVHDRRSGRRRPIATQALRKLGRHEEDDLYGTLLETAMRCGACVLTAVDAVPLEFYSRLASDLDSAGVRLFGDLHGRALDAVLDGGPVELLKVSHEDLEDDGIAAGNDTEVLAAIDKLLGRRVSGIVVSRAADPALACMDGRRYRAHPPEVEVVDAIGAGDSMTAALVAATLAGRGAADVLAVGVAAGAANVARHGLGSASPDLVAELASKVRIEEIDD